MQGHTEYWPLVNRRAHALGGHSPIEDSGLRGAWAAFLATAVRRPSLGPADALRAVVLLLAQVWPYLSVGAAACEQALCRACNTCW